jgi:hypothetical protein
MIQLSPAHRFFISSFCRSEREAFKMARALRDEIFYPGSANNIRMTVRQRILLVFMVGVVTNPVLFILGTPLAVFLSSLFFFKFLKSLVG